MLSRRLLRTITHTPDQPALENIYVSTASQLTTALSSVQPGQQIVLADGTYSGRFKIVDKPATSGQPIVITGSSAAILDGGSTGSGYGFQVDHCAYLTLHGFTVTNSKQLVMCDEMTHCTLDGLTVHTAGQEGIHLRNYSTDNVVKNCEVYDTGIVTNDYGEGIYIGTAYSNWNASSSRTGGNPDTSDRNTVEYCTIYNTAAESIDIKEATSDGIVRYNSFDAVGLTGANYADSWIDVKGNNYLIDSNTATNDGSSALVDGYQVHCVSQASSVSGIDNVFSNNTMTVNSSGYGVYVQSTATGTIVYSSNTVSGAASGLTNISVTSS